MIYREHENRRAEEAYWRRAAGATWGSIARDLHVSVKRARQLHAVHEAKRRAHLRARDNAFLSREIWPHFFRSRPGGPLDDGWTLLPCATSEMLQKVQDETVAGEKAE